MDAIRTIPGKGDDDGGKLSGITGENPSSTEHVRSAYRLPCVGFCDELCQKLPHCIDESSASALLEKTKSKLNMVNKTRPAQIPASTLRKHRRGLEGAAVRLWNKCAMLRREDAGGGPAIATAVRTSLLLYGRVLSALVLSLAKIPQDGSGKDDRTQAVGQKILEVLPWVCKAARFCLGKLLDHAISWQLPSH